jgi:hypothetical protein
LNKLMEDVSGKKNKFNWYSCDRSMSKS